MSPLKRDWSQDGNFLSFKWLVPRCSISTKMILRTPMWSRSQRELLGPFSVRDELEFNFECLLFTHGKLSCKCSKRKGQPTFTERNPTATSYPLLNYPGWCGARSSSAAIVVIYSRFWVESEI